MFENIRDEADAIDIQNKLNKFIELNNKFDYV